MVTTLRNEYGERIDIYPNGEIIHWDIDRDNPLRLFELFFGKFSLVDRDQRRYTINANEISLILDEAKDLAIRITKGERSTYLSNGYCPLCLHEDKELERHHVTWRCDKGNDFRWNALIICKHCHSRLTFGSESDMLLNVVAAYYMQGNYGALYRLQSSERQHFLNILDAIREIHSPICGEWRSLFKFIGRKRYEMFRKATTSRDMSQHVVKMINNDSTYLEIEQYVYGQELA